MMDKRILRSTGVYATKGGRLAFIKEMNTDSLTNETLFAGYILVSRGNKAVIRDLMWMPSGFCISSKDEKDRIVLMV